jgi:P4 family phage/plasmid primase-like protien
MVQPCHSPSQALFAFLSSRRVGKGDEFTHTTMGGSGQPCARAYYISASDQDEFQSLYRDAAAACATDLSLTEKHRHIGPVVIDLDLRFDTRDGPLPHTTTGTDAGRTSDVRALAHQICQIYALRIRELVNVSHMRFFVMARSDGPIPHRAGSAKEGAMKDGLHIIVPEVVTRTDVQLLLRSRVLDDLRELFAASLRGMVSRIEDVVDEAVIEKNNWMMYGSRKPGAEPYRVRSVYEWDEDATSLGVRLSDAPALGDGELADLLSIRNKYTENSLREESLADVDNFSRAREHRNRMRETIQNVIMQEDDCRKNLVTSDELVRVSQLVDLLSPSRADCYNDWIRVGWCLRNIDHRLMDKWEEFSQQSPKYVSTECARLWNKMRTGGLGIGTLHMWAKHDSPEGYLALIRDDLHSLIMQSTNGTHYDVARVVHHMYRYDYVCASIKMRIWYEFRSHRWYETDSAYTLRGKISTEVFGEYSRMMIKLQQQSIVADEAEQKQLMELSQKLGNVALQLKKTAFKDNVMKECCELFMIEKFCDLLDSNCSLVGFENGVYDLERFEFRDGRPDDYISFTTGCVYVPYKPDHPVVADIKKFFEQTHPRPDVREYLLRTLADCLSGHIRHERLNVWTGSGSNGKSITISLMEKALGDYCCKFPVTLLTRQRAASNAATSEIARAKGRRFGVLQEPCENEHLNIGLMKELSGGDTIQCRELYKPPVEWRPQFKLFLQCNHLPSVPSDDGGTWRRIRVVEFKSKFMEKPSPDNPNEFPVDLDLAAKLDRWKEHFITMLVDVYVSTFGQSFEEPEPVMACTHQYQRDNDHLADFVDKCIERSDEPGASLSLDAAFEEWKAWNRAESDGQASTKIRRGAMNKYLDRALRTKGIRTKGSGITYDGYRIIQPDGR